LTYLHEDKYRFLLAQKKPPYWRLLIFIDHLLH
jgi:hypothetical protein